MRHATRESLIRTGQSNIQSDQKSQASMLRAAAAAETSDAELPLNILIM